VKLGKQQVKVDESVTNPRESRFLSANKSQSYINDVDDETQLFREETEGKKAVVAGKIMNEMRLGNCSVNNSRFGIDNIEVKFERTGAQRPSRNTTVEPVALPKYSRVMSSSKSFSLLRHNDDSVSRASHDPKAYKQNAEGKPRVKKTEFASSGLAAASSKAQKTGNGPPASGIKSGF
jgi:hypothetical protein